jgi:outer membrane protein OmpA-like peptidoglycan-associated protein
MTDYYVDSDYEDEEFETEFVPPSDDYDYYEGQDLEEGIDTLRPTEVEGRTSWMYLALLGALFVLLVVFSWACNDRSDTAGEPQTESEAAEVTSGSSTRLDVSVEGDVVTLRGSVPDQAARDQILVETQNLYGAANVIDELILDETTTLEDGIVSVTGAALIDDNRPEQLQAALGSGLGLSQGDFAIDFGSAVVEAVALDAQLASGAIMFSGVVPDDVSVVDLVAAGEAVWGPGSVDASGLAIGDASWTDATITITGSTEPGDDRLAAFVPEVQNRFGALVNVDTSAVTVDQSQEVLTGLEDDIRAQLAEQQILFAPLSADIETESDQVLIDIAAILNLVPDVSVEVVGHTDSAGNDQDNLVLSQDRAAAVITRLVELGVSQSRLNARGEGESVPIADNDTAEGRAENRRIEFRLVSG